MGAHTPKAYVELAGVPLVRRAAEGAAAASLVDRLIVAVPPGDEQRITTLLEGLPKPAVVVAGGATRQASAANALDAVGDAVAVAVHDAARALCPVELFDASLRALDDCEAVCVAVPVSDTIKDVSDDLVSRTLDRSTLFAAQTPQAFRTAVYVRAHEAAASDGVEATDDAALVERIGVPVRIIVGDVRNLKITTPEHVEIAEAMLRS
jgi:2-C-methyl-D-erythritol 4-phosphate cytidylyltransferase